jgi:hypothetical protein
MGPTHPILLSYRPIHTKWHYPSEKNGAISVFITWIWMRPILIRESSHLA